jgi:hypothetical protein
MSTNKFDTLQTRDGSKSVPVATVVDGVAKAWVNFNGTGVVAIRNSFNVLGITDAGVGQYTVTFAVSLPDANYAPLVSGSNGGGTNLVTFVGDGSAAKSANGYRIVTFSSAFSVVDGEFVYSAVFR